MARTIYTPTTGCKSALVRRALFLAVCAGAPFAIDLSEAYAQVETVVVTARKRVENVQNIPVVVTNVSGEQLQRFNNNTIEKLASTTPQLIIQRASSGSSADISLRGIGSSAENLGIEQSVAVNVDSVYYGQGRALEEGLFDVKDVQILKGPQALFYGKNSTAGVIAVETQDPGEKFESLARVGVETTAVVPYVEGYVSGPVTDDFGLRLAVHGSEMINGYVKNTAPAASYNVFDSATLTPGVLPTPAPHPYLGEVQEGLVRATAKWEPTSDFTLTLKATFSDRNANNNADNVVPVFCPLGHPQLDPAHSCGKHWVAQSNALPPAIAAVTPNMHNRGGNPFDDYQSYTFVVNATYDQPNYSITSVTGYQHLFVDWANDEDFTATDAVQADEHHTWKAFSTELRGITKLDWPVNFAGGLYYQTTELNFLQDVIFFGSEDTAAPPADRFVSYNKHSETTDITYSAYGQFIWEIVPSLELTGGARYTHERKISFFLQPFVNPFLRGLFIPFTPGNPATIVNGNQTFDNLSPEATLTWKPEDNLTFFAGYKRGFKSGGFSGAAILSTLGIKQDLIFKPEKAQGFEGGVKSTWFDEQLLVDADVYNYLYTDLQVDFFNTPTFNYVTLNAGSARTKGVELDAEYVPEEVKGLSLRFDGAFNESHYGHFIAPCSPAGLTFNQGCTLARVIDNPVTGAFHFAPTCDGVVTACGFFDASGRPTANAPKWTASFGVNYDRPVFDDLLLGLSSSVRFSSSYIANGFPSVLALTVDRQSAYGMLDLAARLGSQDQKWEIAVIAKNVTDSFVFTGAQGLPLSGAGTGLKGAGLVSDQGGTVLDPRTLAIQFTYRPD